MPALYLQNTSDMNVQWTSSQRLESSPSPERGANGNELISSDTMSSGAAKHLTHITSESQANNNSIRLAPQTPYLLKSCTKGVHSNVSSKKAPSEEEECARSFLARRKKYINKSPSSKISEKNVPTQENSHRIADKVSPVVQVSLHNKTSESLNSKVEPPTPQISSPKKHVKRHSLPPLQNESPRSVELCAPSSRSYSGVSDSAVAWGTLGHYNILHVTTSDPGQHWFTRFCCYIAHCKKLNVNFSYPSISNETIVEDERVKAALDQTVSEIAHESKNAVKSSHILTCQIKRAHSILNNMKAAISTSLIRLTGYVLFKVFSRLLMSVVVHKGQLEAVQKASKTGTPLIFVPLHRSHLDYLFVTWVLFNCQIPAPIVAAGDNLNMPVFGALLRGTGGFFIKRKLESNKARKDILYRALLQCYMSHALHAGYNLEFFIEGGRTRTGKPGMPKGGLLSVILDAYLSGLLDDAMIVPIAINYDKLVDGNFIREQMGQNKVPESFWGAVCAICKVLSTNYGQSRIDFGNPFSLKEFVLGNKEKIPNFHANDAPAGGIKLSEPVTNRGHCRSLSSPITSHQLSLKRVPSNPLSSEDSPSLSSLEGSENCALQPAMSSSSLFGTELTDEFRNMVKNLGRHIVFDAERCQAMMSSNLVAWILSYLHREKGASLSVLSSEMETVRELLRSRHRDVGFTGNAQDAVKHAVHLLGPKLVSTSVNESGECVYKAVTLLPNIIEVNYYASALLPVFALDGIVSTVILSCVDSELSSYVDCETDILISLDEIMKRSTRLCELLCNEFVLAAPCSDLSKKLLESVERHGFNGLLREERAASSRLRYPDTTSWLPSSSDEDEQISTPSYSVLYKISPTSNNLKQLTVYAKMLKPILDAYCATIQMLQSLVDKREMSEKEFVSEVQSHIRDRIDSGVYCYGECIAADPIKNCIRMLEGESVIEIILKEGVRCLCLRKSYDNLNSLQSLQDSILVLTNCI